MQDSTITANQNVSNPDAPTKESDLSDTTRSIHIVTTASLPWLTGTAVNPLLRALYFQKSRTSPDAKVTLVIPWVERKEERQEVYPNHQFADGKAGRKEQEALVRNWCVEKAGMEAEAQSLRIQFYPSTYQKKLGSILPLVDICSLIPAEGADVCILEEPEHLNWFAMPSYSKDLHKKDDFLPSNDIGWMGKFKHVIGIIHTNYQAYARSYGVRGSRTLASKTIHALSTLVCRSYCHKVVKLSATLPVFARYKECVCNTHGVRSDFLRKQGSEPDTVEDGARVYFIGKCLWAKGFNFMLQCEEKFKAETGDFFPIDIYGGGPDQEAIKRSFFGVRGSRKDSLDEKDDTVMVEKEDADECNVEDNNTSQNTSADDKNSDDESDHHSEKMSAYAHLSKIMLASMPFLSEEIENEDETDGKDEGKSSTFQSFKDGIQLMKRFPKESFHFDLELIPRTRYEWRKTPIPARFLGPVDHAALKFTPHKIFLNPSITEVLCTTTAEALAMNKFAIIPVHPSNEFFYQFPNCLAYKDMDEFVAHMKYALNHEPTPMTEELLYCFTWDAAMERLVEAADITNSQKIQLEEEGRIQRDIRKAWIHKESGKMIKGELLKGIVGDAPQENLVSYDIDENLNTFTYLSFEKSTGGIVAFLSFLLAIISYFLQR